VRSLAGRSAEAAKEIKTLINASVENVESGSQQVADAGAAMAEIVSSVRRVTDLIGEITASSDEQRSGISQVNAAVGQLDQMTQQNAALVEESAAAAASLRDQAQRLTEVVAVFNLGQGHAPSARTMAQAPRTSAVPAPAALRSAPRPSISASKSPAPASPRAALPSASASAAPKAGNEDDWTSF